MIVGLLLTGCGVTMPSDPEGTLDRVSGGVLRVGVSPAGERVTLDGAGPDGGDVELVEAFADTVDARIDWVIGSEEAHVRALEAGDLDLVVGAITDETPWIDRAGVTRPYLEVTDDDGTKHRLVMLTRMGENAFITTLERFLTEHGQAQS